MKIQGKNKYLKWLLLVGVVAVILILGVVYFIQNNKISQSMTVFESKFAPLSMTAFIGEEEAAVYEALGIQEEDIASTWERANDRFVLLKNPLLYQEKTLQLQLTIYNGMLSEVAYIFQGQDENGWEFSKQLYQDLEKKYGEAKTYPTMSNRVEGLTLEQLQKEEYNLYRDFWVVDDLNFEKFYTSEEQKESYRGDLKLTVEKRPNAENVWEIAVGLSPMFNQAGD
ncbi:MAG: hypothetical protein Q4D90_09625 [bacterium]|nr:hypothetical protein [bacterium]